MVGLLNTLLVVSVIGIVFATVIGFVVGIGPAVAQLAAGPPGRRLRGIVRNLPLLFQILFWYLAVLATLPNPRQSIALFGQLFLNNRGFVVPEPIANSGFWPVMTAVARRRRRRRWHCGPTPAACCSNGAG